VVAIAPNLWSAEFDPGQISHVIANLVVNAEQAMPDGGTLHVDCDNFPCPPEKASPIPDLVPGDYIRIRVRDEGVGIPEQYLKQIFDPYFTTKPSGNGLGLATTYSIVKNQSGHITVESAQDCGSTFTVYLPATRQETVPIKTAPTSDEPINGTGRILFVDDEEGIRALAELALSRFGYEVVGAETASQGIELYREALICGQRFDLVILDLTLPGGIGGKEALKALIEIDPMVTAIVSSGYAMDATRCGYEDLGFRGVIVKPYEAAELGRTVCNVISASRLGCEFQRVQL
jgi:CheY-like chemotaxis protein